MSASATSGGIREALAAILSENFLYGEELDCGEDESLLEAGVLDSTGVVELVAHLEVAFGFRVDEDEMTPENLDSLTALSRYVGGKLGLAAGAA